MSATATLDQPFRFSTKRYDEGTGLSYYGYRFYAPVIERWLNRDPLGEAGGVNLYGFVLNDPVNSVDPEGLWVVPVVVGLYAVGAVWIFKDCMERCTGKKICEKEKEVDTQTVAKCANICIKYAALMGFGADPLGATSSEVGTQVGNNE